MSILRRLLGRERRESYTEQIVNLRVAQASSRDVRAALTGSLESAAGIVSRAMLGADVRGTALLTPQVLRDASRDLIRVVRASGSCTSLLPASRASSGRPGGTCEGSTLIRLAGGIGCT